MKKPILVLAACALCLLACGGTPSAELAIPSGAPEGFTTDVVGNPCNASEYLVGLLVITSGSGLAIRDDQGKTTPLIWSMGYSARWVTRGQIEVLDRSGAVVATTGHRYKIGGGGYFPSSREFWACADVVIPQPEP